MTDKARRSYEIVFDRESAHRIVRLLEEGMKAFDRSLKFPDGSKQEAAALNHANDLFRSAGCELGWLACTNLPLNVHRSQNNGVPEELRMALTGHRSRNVHQHYTHHELERLRDAVALLPCVK